MAAEGHAVFGLGLNRVSAQAMKWAGATSIEMAPQMIHRRLDGADLGADPDRRVSESLDAGIYVGRSDASLVQAVLGSPAQKVLLPINKRKVEVVGTERRTLDALIDHAVQRIASLFRPII